MGLLARFGFDNNGRSWVSYDEKDFEGIGCLVIGGGAVIGILTLLGFILDTFVYWLMTAYINVKEATAPVVDLLLIKILFLPAFWDRFISGLNDNYFIKAILFIIVFLLISLILHKVTNKWIRTYIQINRLLIVAKIVVFILVSILSLLGAKTIFFNENIILQNPTIITIDSANLNSENNYSFTKEELEEFGGMGDATNEKKYKSTQWFRFVNNTGEKASAYKEFSYKVEDFYFKDIKEFNKYKTVISYIPFLEGYEHTNKSSFTIQFVGDGKLIKEYYLTPENPVIPVEFDFNIRKDLIVKIQGDLLDDSIVSFLETEFSR